VSTIFVQDCRTVQGSQESFFYRDEFVQSDDGDYDDNIVDDDDWFI